MRMLANIISLGTALFHDKMGPRLTCILGLIFLVTGMSLTYLACLRVFVIPYYVLGMFMTLCSCGTYACYTSGLSTCLKNFDPKHRGKVVGVLLCVYGLTGGLFSAIFQFVFLGNLVAFIFFMLVFVSSVPVVGIIFLNVVPKQKTEESVASTEETRLITPEAGEDATPINNQEEIEKTKEDDENVPTYRVILTLEFWLFAICIFCSMGSSVCLISNIGTVVQSYGGPPSIVAILMIIYSVASSTGRIVVGLLSDQLSSYMTRATFLNISFVIIGTCLFTLIFAVIPMFYPLIFIFGFSYGGMMSMTPTMISDRWGTKYFATNSSTCFLFQLLGSYLLGTVMASSIYQSHIVVEGGKRCRGRACFQLTFIICTALCLVSFMTALVLMHRSKKLYVKLNKQKTAKA
jgi:MFS family permease